MNLDFWSGQYVRCIEGFEGVTLPIIFLPRVGHRYMITDAVPQSSLHHLGFQPVEGTFMEPDLIYLALEGYRVNCKPIYYESHHFRPEEPVSLQKMRERAAKTPKIKEKV